MEIGYWLSSEEHDPQALVEHARLADEAGFEFVLVSDHYHPWVDAQGHSSFVWAVLGAIAAGTKRVRVGTAVTCPLIRMHPAVVAQAAATAQILFGGRFFLGLGTGENLNEHVVGGRWPRADERLEMLGEAIDVIRALFGGKYETYRGRYYTVEQARLYDVPDEPPPLIVAAAASEAAKVAAEKGDGYMNTFPDEDVVRIYRDAGGREPLYGKITGAYATDVETARRIGKERAPNSPMGGSLTQDLALPRDFESVAELVREDDVAGSLVLGPDESAWREQLDAYERAGFTHVCLHNVAQEQREFIAFARRLA